MDIGIFLMYIRTVVIIYTYYLEMAYCKFKYFIGR